ncbi:hypothetical protein F5B19DRAFT_209947 [Rostrohypoxylon terebratum]|nr:hypothetical protein F5B19DRAFT_209947 [Rostrohypoxylon terebratum]
MMPSSRATPPAPLNIRASSETTHSHGRQDSFDSYSDNSKVGSITSHAQLLGSNHPQETHRTSRFDEYRKSFSYHQPSPNNHKFSKPHSPTVNVYTHCGRHTDQYLFGGWSNAFKHAFKKD